MGEPKMRLVCIVKNPVTGEEELQAGVLASSVLPGMAVKIVPGIGKPYLVFNSLPEGHDIVNWNPAGAPVVSSSIPTNTVAINTMLADPDSYLAMLTFNPPLEPNE